MDSPPPDKLSRQRLRHGLLARRRALAPALVRAAARSIARRLWRLPALARARRIACYLPANGEVDCGLIIEQAWARGRCVLVPVLDGEQLGFAPFRPDSTVFMNRYGIFEPEHRPGDLVRPRELDIVLTPLLGFDAEGNRLGMGGGYYDRSFRFLRWRQHWQRPQLIGLAYAFQQIDTLESQPWDVPLDGVVTETASVIFAAGSDRLPDAN